MVKLIAETPLAAHLSVASGDLSLSEVAHDRIQGIAPFKGQETSVSQVLKAAVGQTLPSPNEKRGPTLWVGPGQYLILGQWIEGLEGSAAITDQSDAWAILAVEGEDVEDVLARLIPVDLRSSRFKVGQTARTLIGHMAASVTRVAPDRFELIVMRSMGATLVHEVAKAAELYAKRA